MTKTSYFTVTNDVYAARGIEAEAGASQHQHWRRRQQEVDWDRVNDDRKYLNGLVEASVLKTKEQVYFGNFGHQLLNPLTGYSGILGSSSMFETMCTCI